MKEKNKYANKFYKKLKIVNFNGEAVLEKN